MVAGDCMSGVVSLANGATTWVQPAAGEEWCVTMATTRGTGGIYLGDGTNTTTLGNQALGIGEGNGGVLLCRMRLFITETYHLGIYNNLGSATYVSYSGFKTVE